LPIQAETLRPPLAEEPLAEELLDVLLVERSRLVPLRRGFNDLLETADVDISLSLEVG
jgi:hypothetical protein